MTRRPFVPPVQVDETPRHMLPGHRHVYRDSDGAFIGTIHAVERSDGTTTVTVWPAPQFASTYRPDEWPTFTRPVDGLDALLDAAEGRTVEQLGDRSTPGWTGEQWAAARV